jgi:hypothetical protein
MARPVAEGYLFDHKAMRIKPRFWGGHTVQIRGRAEGEPKLEEFDYLP